MSLADFAFIAALAAAAALAFTAVTAATARLAGIGTRRRLFTIAIAHEPAERLWRMQHRLGQQRALAGFSILAFILTAAALIAAEPDAPEIFQNPLVAQVALLLCGALLGVALYRLVMTTWQRRRLRLWIDASLAIAHALRRLTASRNRVFHDVTTNAGVIDHVLIGQHGIYAVTVCAERPAKDPQLVIEDDAIRFPDGRRWSLAPALRQAEALAQDCRKLLGHEVHVRLVVGVPGWDIAEQSKPDVLVTNARNIVMLTGWKDARDHLLDEDVATLHDALDERCSRR